MLVGMAQNHVQLRRQPLFIGTNSNPAVVPGVEPEQRRPGQQREYLGHDDAAVSAENSDVFVARELARSPFCQRRV